MKFEVEGLSCPVVPLLDSQEFSFVDSHVSSMSDHNCSFTMNSYHIKYACYHLHRCSCNSAQHHGSCSCISYSCSGQYRCDDHGCTEYHVITVNQHHDAKWPHDSTSHEVECPLSRMHDIAYDDDNPATKPTTANELDNIVIMPNYYKIGTPYLSRKWWVLHLWPPT